MKEKIENLKKIHDIETAKKIIEEYQITIKKRNTDTEITDAENLDVRR